LNRYNFYFKQLVGESDLDGAFDKAEAADHAIITDQGVFGIMSGLNVAEVGVPNLTVDVSIGRGYDQQGRRILNPATQNVDLSSVLPLGGGNLKWVSVAIRFARFESDPRVDGNNVNIFYNLAESFELFLVEGAESAGPPARPGKPGNGLVLADILLVQGMTEVTNGDIDQATDGRRDWAFELLATTPAQVKAGTITEVAQEVLNELNNHINGAANEHPATAISTSPSAPALARGLTASDVQTNLDELATAFAALGFSNTFTGPNTFDQDVDINAILTVTDSLIATMDFDLGTNDTHFGSLLANVTMGDSAAYAHVFNGDVTLGFDATNLVVFLAQVGSMTGGVGAVPDFEVYQLQSEKPSSGDRQLHHQDGELRWRDGDDDYVHHGTEPWGPIPSVPVLENFGPAAAETDGPTVSVTLTGTAFIYVSANGNLLGTAGDTEAGIRVDVDGVDVYDETFEVFNTERPLVWSTSFSVQKGAGTFDVKIKFRRSAGAGSVNLDSSAIFVMPF
jgi:hypothetical protein